MLGLGSNLGDRQAHIEAAIAAIRADRDLRVLRCSPIYETPPAGGPPQGPYLNGAVLVVTSLEASLILERVLVIERGLGRVRSEAEKWGPRTIDIDILWVEGEASSDPGLTIPHARLHERAFALRPLLDVAPDAIDFATGAPLASLPIASAPIAFFADAPRSVR